MNRLVGILALVVLFSVSSVIGVIVPKSDGWRVFIWSAKLDDLRWLCTGASNDEIGVKFITAGHCVDVDEDGVLDEAELKAVLDAIQIPNADTKNATLKADNDVFYITDGKTKIEIPTPNPTSKPIPITIKTVVYNIPITKSADGYYTLNPDDFGVWWLPPKTPILIITTTSRAGMSGSPIFNNNGELIGVLIGGDTMLTIGTPVHIAK